MDRGIRMSKLKSAVRNVLPRPVVAAIDKLRRLRTDRRNRSKTTEQVFTEIYANNLWGGQSGTYNSGSGSRQAAVVSPYVQKLREELQRIGASSLSAVDLGCGDFSVGQHLAPYCGHYIGIDIVRPLIEYNQATFGDDRVCFRHANILEDELPKADICFVRQVLQHLSNEQIARVLPKLQKYRWCFVTEHQAADSFGAPNIDKPHGDRIRIDHGSGVFLDEPPFNVPKKQLHLLLEADVERIGAEHDPGVIRTYLMTAEQYNP